MMFQVSSRFTVWLLSKVHSSSLFWVGMNEKLAQLQHFVHPCSRVENVPNGCWKKILTSFRLETGGRTAKSHVEYKTPGWCGLLLCSKFNCYLDLGSEENASVPSRLNWQAGLFAFMFSSAGSKLSAFSNHFFFFSLKLSDWFTELSCHSNLSLA